MKQLASEGGVSSGPGQEAARTVENFSRRPRPIDQAVLLFEDRSKGCFVGILLHRHGIFAERSNQKLSSGFSEPAAKLESILFGTDFGFPFEKHVAGIESGVDAHSRNASACFAVGYSSLDRG